MSSAGYLSLSDIELLDQAVLVEFDGLDGVLDGLIQDPCKCIFLFEEPDVQRPRNKTRLSD